MTSPGDRPALIALVGDYGPDVLAHRAIHECFALAQRGVHGTIDYQWLPTDSIHSGDEHALKPFSGIWGVPASPYRSMHGALWAIEFARTRKIPFLGTCGGYQHALLEFARNVLDLKEAGHTESDPHTPLPLLDRMKCSLIEESKQVVVSDNAFRALYGSDRRAEGFHCSYGLNPAFEPLFASAALKIVARSEQGEARAVQLTGHPFFIGTAFQPERDALRGSLHPLVESFFTHAISKG
jgi:CTP synthase (UTP-ammonia lyase)